MNKTEWLQKFNDNYSLLADIVINYHPTLPKKSNNVVITAEYPEKASEIIRQSIKREYKEDETVITQLANAKINQDADKLITILNQTWFGIPESTSCWRIPGFGLLCDLCEGYDE